MRSDWKEVSLGDIASFSQGLQVPVDDQLLEFSEEYSRFVRIIDHTNDVEPPRYIKTPDQKYFVSGDDVVMIRYGSQTAGRIVRGKPGFIANNMFKINLNVDYIDKGFLFYFLGSREIYNFLRSAQSSSTMPAITFGMLKPIVIKYPPLEKQKKIASIIDGISEKIELNRQTNQTLEHIAQAIFKSWFVDFEPTRAKIAASEAGECPERAAMAAISGKLLEELDQLSPEQQTQLKTTAALFPDALVDSELGEVPQRWEVRRISDFGKVVTGKTPPKIVENAYADSGVFFITPTDIDNSVFVTSTNRFLTPEGQLAIKNTLIKAGSICVTCIGSQMGKAIISPNDAFTNQQINSIVVKKSYCRNYLLLNLRNRREEIYDIGSSGSTMPIINKTTFEKLEVILPNADLLRRFDIIVEPQMNKILEGALESIELADVRDLLLPKLLSGELAIETTQTELEDVV